MQFVNWRARTVTHLRANTAISRIPKYVFCINFRHRLYLKQPFTFFLAQRSRARWLPHLRSSQRIRFACAHFFCMQPTSFSKRDPEDAFLISPSMLFNEPSFLSKLSGRHRQYKTFGAEYTYVLDKSTNLLVRKCTFEAGSRDWFLCNVASSRRERKRRRWEIIKLLLAVLVGGRKEMRLRTREMLSNDKMTPIKIRNPVARGEIDRICIPCSTEKTFQAGKVEGHDAPRVYVFHNAREKLAEEIS